MKKYYEAYDERYKTIHEKGYGWFSGERTPIVAEVAAKYAPAESPEAAKRAGSLGPHRANAMIRLSS